MNRALFLGLLLPLALGCRKNKDAEGPMERAGHSIDKAAEKTGEAVKTGAQKTKEGVGKAAHATGEAFEKAGEKLKGDDEPPAPSESAK